MKKDGAVQPEYHVNDYLCSVRVVTVADGEVLERNDYSGFGKRLASSAVTPAAGSANRYRFSGKEEQGFAGVPWQDFGARMYDPDLARWTTPDPLAEKYPGISPYVYCNDNPVNFVDPDGRFPDIIWDVASIGMGIHNLVQNVKAGNVWGAVGDGAGIVLDVAAAIVPIVPGGVGAIRAGAKTVDAVDNAVDATKAVKAAKGAEIADESGSIIRNAESSLVSSTASKGGENASTKLGRQMHKDYNPGDGYIKEFTLPSGKRADAVSLEKGDVRELKPNNSRAIKRGEKQAQSYMNELQTLYPDIKWEYHIDVYNK